MKTWPVLFACSLLACSSPEDRALQHARALAVDAIIVDGHIDVPYRMTQWEEDVTEATVGGDFDAVRAKAGGLDAPFMSIYLPPRLQSRPGASRVLADSLIDLVEGFVMRAPDRFALAYSVSDVRANHAAGRISLPMGMENGSPFGEDPNLLGHFYTRGIRYVTLTHGQDNGLSDSSYDSTRTWNGLSPRGELVVGAMNRIGIMVDISHVSDSAFYDVMRTTQAPVIASHSSARVFTPGWQRNLNDDQLRRVAENGGVVMVVFGSAFLDTSYQGSGDVLSARSSALADSMGLSGDARRAFLAAERRSNPVGTVEDVARHIDHVVSVAGIDHVGLGSDFDGVYALPAGLQDVSEYPNLVRVLLDRGYSEGDIRKVLGENLLRVWEAVETVASES